MQLKKTVLLLGSLSALAVAQDDTDTTTESVTAVVTVTSAVDNGASVITNVAVSLTTDLIPVTTAVVNSVSVTDLQTVTLLPSLDTVTYVSATNTIVQVGTFLSTTATASSRYDTGMDTETVTNVVATVTDTAIVGAGGALLTTDDSGHTITVTDAGAAAIPTTGAAAIPTAMAGALAMIGGAAALMIL